MCMKIEEGRRLDYIQFVDKCFSDVETSGRCKVKELASVKGKRGSCTFVVSRGSVSAMQNDIQESGATKQWQKSSKLSPSITPSQAALAGVVWWRRVLASDPAAPIFFNGKRCFMWREEVLTFGGQFLRTIDPSILNLIVVHGDAATSIGTGWGGTANGARFQGLFNDRWSSTSINAKEAITPVMLLEAFLASGGSARSKVIMYYSTSTIQLRKRPATVKGSPTSSEMADASNEIRTFVLKHCCELVTGKTFGAENPIADALSRFEDSAAIMSDQCPERSLSPRCWKIVENKFPGLDTVAMASDTQPAPPSLDFSFSVNSMPFHNTGHLLHHKSWRFPPTSLVYASLKFLDKLVTNVPEAARPRFVILVPTLRGQLLPLCSQLFRGPTFKRGSLIFRTPSSAAEFAADSEYVACSSVPSQIWSVSFSPPLSVLLQMELLLRSARLRISAHLRDRVKLGDIALAPEGAIVHICCCTAKRPMGIAKAIFKVHPAASRYHEPPSSKPRGSFEHIGKIVNVYAMHFPGPPRALSSSSSPPGDASTRLEFFGRSMALIPLHLARAAISSVAVPLDIGAGMCGGRVTDYALALDEFVASCRKLNITVVLYQLPHSR